MNLNKFVLSEHRIETVKKTLNAVNPEVNGEARVHKVLARTFHWEYLMRKKRWKVNKRITIRRNIHKSTLFAAGG